MSSWNPCRIGVQLLYLIFFVRIGVLQKFLEQKRKLMCGSREKLVMAELKIPNDILERMVVQAKAEAPVEACGVLAGSDGKIEKMYEMTNVANSSDHFMMAPAEQFAAVKDMRAAGLEMLAVYHSHPATPARPSAEDIRLAFTPGVIYIILSLEDPENYVVKGFNIENGNVTEVPVVISV